jgi:hypothetical protein
MEGPWEGTMNLSDKAVTVLGHLALAPDAYLFGKRENDTPLSLIDKAALTRRGADSLPLVERQVIRELLDAGYIEDITGAPESLNIGFRISDKGRDLFPKPRSN